MANLYLTTTFLRLISEICIFPELRGKVKTFFSKKCTFDRILFKKI